MSCNLFIKNLTLERNQKIIIENFNIDTSPPALWALVGDNGSGKSTLLHGIAGLLPIKSGNILFNNSDILQLPPNQRAQLLTLLPQSSPLQPYCLARSRIAHGLIPNWGYCLNLPTQAGIKLIASNLNISHLLDRTLGSISGGEQRLVHIAKTLVNPHLSMILLDEPSAFLDFTQKHRLANLLSQRAEKNCLIIFSSHDLDFIAHCATKIMFIKQGKINILNHDQFCSSFGSLSKRVESATLGDIPS